MNDDITTALLAVADRFSDKLGSRNLLTEAVDEINRLRAERDEARREVCVLMRQAGFLCVDYANERGWDCFKENTNDR